MSRIIDEFQVGKYRVLKVESLPELFYKKLKIDGKLFSPVSTYDMTDCVSIEYTGEQSFINRNIEFI